jgi:hypothetical protein
VNIHQIEEYAKRDMETILGGLYETRNKIAFAIEDIEVDAHKWTPNQDVVLYMIDAIDLISEEIKALEIQYADSTGQSWTKVEVWDERLRRWREIHRITYVVGV